MSTLCLCSSHVVFPSERPPRHSGEVPHPVSLLLGLHVLSQPRLTFHLSLLARLQEQIHSRYMVYFIPVCVDLCVLSVAAALSFFINAKYLLPVCSLFAQCCLYSNDEGCFTAFFPPSVSLLISAVIWRASLDHYQTEQFLIMCAQRHALSLCVEESGLSRGVCYSVMQRHKAQSSKQLSNRHC